MSFRIFGKLILKYLKDVYTSGISKILYMLFVFCAVYKCTAVGFFKN